MKKLFFVSAILLSSVLVNAQDGNDKSISLSGGADLSMPVGDMGEIYSFGIGASLQADFKIAEKASLNLNLGYNSFLYAGGEGGSTAIIPILGGARYWLSDKFYASAQGGIGIASSEGESETGVMFAPGLGYRLSNIDLNLKYNTISFSAGEGESFNLGFLNLRASYNF
jgi:hypothetical protein